MNVIQSLLTHVNNPHTELDMFRRIFKRNIYKRQDKHIIWGIRVPEKVKIRWIMLSAIMRVPCNRLILFILQDWVRQNAETLADDKARNQLADRVTGLYLKGSLH